MEDKKTKYFTIDTMGYQVVINLYSEPNNGGNMSKYALKGFRGDKIHLIGVYNISAKRYIHLNNAIKAGIKLSKHFENCEIIIRGIDVKGFTTKCVYLSEII
jgi:hypothetical protein